MGYLEETFQFLINDKYLRYADFADSNTFYQVTNKTIIGEGTKLLVGETNSQVITFVMDRFIDGVDLIQDTKTVKILYVNKSTNLQYADTVINFQYSDNYIKFMWLVDIRATSKAGDLNISVMVEGIDEKGNKYISSTIPYTFKVDTTLLDSDIILPTDDFDGTNTTIKNGNLYFTNGNYNLGRVALVIKGDFNINATYDTLDIVYQNGSSYIAKRPNSGQLLSNEIYWYKMAEGGSGGNGADGFSPIANVTPITGGAKIIITDKLGTTTVNVMNGTNGVNGLNGDDGFSPTATVSKTGNTATITITDKNGTTTKTVSDGVNGSNGTDGFSPTATVTKSGSVATISITDKNGTTTATVSDGNGSTDVSSLFTTASDVTSTNKVWSSKVTNDKINSAISNLQAAAVRIIDLTMTSLLQKGYLTTTGSIVGNGTDENWVYTPNFIDLTPYAGGYLDCHLYGHTGVASVIFYTSSNTLISYVKATADGSFYNNTNLAIPANATKAKFSFGTGKLTTALGATANDDGTSYVIAHATGGTINVTKVIDSTFISRWEGYKIALCGDSISSTDYTWYKDWMESLTRATVNNIGQSGASTATIASNAYFSTIANNSPDLAIFLVGGNDTGESGTVGTFSSNSPNGILGESVVTETSIASDYSGTKFVQAVSHIIRKFKSTYYNFRTLAALTGSETEAEKTAKLDAIKKPKIVFCTTLPQKRNNSSDAFSIEQNWIRKANAVKECCAKYDVMCIDLYEKCRWDMSLEPYWIAPTDKVTNNGIYTMDGLHPNKYGYQDMATIIFTEINSIPAR